MWYGDLRGREFAVKPINIGELVYIRKGWLDTFNDDELYKEQLAIIIDVNPIAGTLMPMYDVIYCTKEGKYLSYELRLNTHVVYKACIRKKSEGLITLVNKIKKKCGSLWYE